MDGILLLIKASLQALIPLVVPEIKIYNLKIRSTIFFGSGICLPKQGEPFFTSSGKVFWQWEIIGAIFFGRGISLPQQGEPFFSSSGKVFWQWELITGSGNALSILFLTALTAFADADHAVMSNIFGLSISTSNTTLSRSRTMDTTIEQQAAMDEALVPHAQSLRIGRSNFCLLSDIKSKESTLQLVYDVPNYGRQPLSIIMLSDSRWIKKHIVNLESFRDMLHICPRVHGQSFAEPPFEEEILVFIRFLGHSAAIKTLTNVKHKNTKKSNEMYYPRFTKVIILHFMSKDPSISRRNKFSALLPIEPTNDEIRNSNAYKEYYAIATGAAPPKPKASTRRTRSSSDTSITPPTATASPRLTAFEKGKQTAKASKASKAKSLSALSKNYTDDEGANDEGKDGDDDDEDDEGDDGQEGNGDDDDDDEDNDGEEGDDDDVDQEVVRDDEKDDEEEGRNDEHEFDEDESDEETMDEESFDPIPQTLENSEDEEEEEEEEEKEDELYKDVNINQGRGLQASLEVEDSHVTLTPVNPDGQQQSSSVSLQFVTSMLNPTIDLGMESIFETTSQLDVQTPTSVALLPILRSLEANFSEAMQTNQFAGAVSAIPGTVHQYMDQRMNKAVKVAVQIQSNHLQDKAQRDNDEFLKTIDENMKRIIKEQVKEQVMIQVSKILPRIEQAVNEQLEAEVLTRSSHSSKTSYVVAADLSKMELKKILIEKINGNKSILRYDEQRNLYKALVEAYESDKIILDTYGKTVTLKRRRDDDADKDEEPSARPDRGSKRRRERKEPQSASAPIEIATRSAGRSTQGSRSRQASASESALAEEPMQTTSQMEEPSHLEFDTGAEDQPIVQSSQHPEWFSQQQKPPSLDCAWNKIVPAVYENI
nr:hypothetical protein [Tanacetum cinerariifolium]